MLKSFIQIFIFLINAPVYWATKCIKRDPNIWVFGAWFGDSFSDNSKYLFLYLSKMPDSPRCIWLSKNADVISHIRKLGYEAYLTYSLKGYYFCSRAAIGVLSTGIKDINRYAAGGMNLAQLWHGTPLKQIMHDDEMHYRPKNIIQRFAAEIFPFLKGEIEQKNVWLFAPSQKVATLFSSAFSKPFDKIFITGYPRNDSFFISHKPYPISAEIYKQKESGKTVGLYLPTHRRGFSKDFLSFLKEGVSTWEEANKEEKYILYTKVHYYHSNEVAKIKNDGSTFKFISNKDIESDVYNILSDVDFLVTDYSSVYFDFMLSEKPIFYLPYDLDQYLSFSRKLYFDYNSVIAGPCVPKWEDLFKELSLDYGSRFNEKYLKLQSEFNQHVDGDNCKRTYSAIMDHILNCD